MKTDFGLNALAAIIDQINADKGWNEGDWGSLDVQLGKLALVHAELSEALEELRAGHAPADVYFHPTAPAKPEGFPIEIIDAMVRLLHICARLGIDADGAMTQKLAYNRTRPYRHGKKA